MVLIRIFLIANGVKQLFICLFAIYVSSWVKYFDQVLGPFINLNCLFSYG